MDFRSLQYFTMVAEELNFSRAAEKLNMSQPPLSNQIKQLEEDLGVQLFIRGKRHLKLTEAGNLLLRRSRQILALSGKTREELYSLGNEFSGRICLGMVEGMAPYLAAGWIAGFRKAFPRVTYELWNGSSDDVIDQLKRGLVDIAVIAAPYDHEHLDGIEVGVEPWVAIIPKSHQLATVPGDTIPLASLIGEPLIIPKRPSRRVAIEQWFEGIGAEPNILCALANYVDAAALAEENAGISIFPQSRPSFNPAVVCKVITNPAKIARYILVWNKEQPPTGLALEFINFVRNIPAPDENSKKRTSEDIRFREFVIPDGADLL
ncbi:MAG: LysR family transcriptional regulator [Lachnospiraceae bacterium]|jgi:DNA-binding transcriptional LysR family regulator|nr:LysR family transcriptional regulator [Lachnospiraceae bacterium]